MKAPRVKRLFYVSCISLIVSIILLVIWTTVSRREYTILDVNQPSLNDNNGHPRREYTILDVNQPSLNDGHPLPHEHNHTTTNTSHHHNNSQPVTNPVTDPPPPDVTVSTPPPSSTVSMWFPPRVIHHYGVNDWSSSMESPSVWKDQFCKEFLGTTFDKSSTVCSDDRIVCYGSHHNKHIGKCMVSNLAVKPKALKDSFAMGNFGNRKSAWLMASDTSDNRACQNPHLNDIRQFMEGNDPFHKLIKLLSVQSQVDECEVVVRGVSFFHMGVGDHIYFKMLSWYNLHRTLLQYSKTNNLSNFIIVRLPESKSPFKFPEFEQSLFPQLFEIKEFPNDKIVCFEKVVLVPWTYAATPFRCKMDGSDLKRKCMGCHGNGLETDLRSFRRRVLSTCSLDDNNPINKQRRTILVIERKQYIRRLGDAHGKFQRVWTNSKELIEKLKSTFTNDNIIGIYGEDLSICDQVRHAHNADVLIGMHGAGLVHIWWLRDNTISFELVPPSQRGNGAFSTLSTLLGKKHYQFNIVKERGAIVTVDVGKLVKEISSKL